MPIKSGEKIELKEVETTKKKHQASNIPNKEYICFHCIDLKKDNKGHVTKEVIGALLRNIEGETREIILSKNDTDAKNPMELTDISEFIIDIYSKCSLFNLTTTSYKDQMISILVTTINIIIDKYNKAPVKSTSRLAAIITIRIDRLPNRQQLQVAFTPGAFEKTIEQLKNIKVTLPEAKTETDKLIKGQNDKIKKLNEKVERLETTGAAVATTNQENGIKINFSAATDEETKAKDDKGAELTTEIRNLKTQLKTQTEELKEKDNEINELNKQIDGDTGINDHTEVMKQDQQTREVKNIKSTKSNKQVATQTEELKEKDNETNELTKKNKNHSEKTTIGLEVIRKRTIDLLCTAVVFMAIAGSLTYFINFKNFENNLPKNIGFTVGAGVALLTSICFVVGALLWAYDKDKEKDKKIKEIYLTSCPTIYLTSCPTNEPNTPNEEEQATLTVTEASTITTDKRQNMNRSTV